MTQWLKNVVTAAATVAIAGLAPAKDMPAPAAAKVATASAPAAVSCDARTTLTRLHAASFDAAFSMSPGVCNSLKAVVARLFNTSRAGGRKLEADRPLDLAAAEQQRQAALVDPSFKAELDQLLAAEADPLRRQLLEAALLHDFGHFLARDLVLQQLGTRLRIEK